MNRSSRWKVALACLWAIALAPCAAHAAGYRHFGWQQVADGVWFGTTLPNSFQTGNTIIVALPTGGSMVIDSQDSDFLAKEILDKVREVAPGPVRYLVDTHLHQDHVGGNAAFRAAFPGVQIIAHRNTCVDIPRKTMPRMQDRLEPMRRQLDEMNAKRATLADGAPEAAALDRRIEGTTLYLDDAKDFHWALPDVCLDLRPGDAKVIDDGGRRIEIRYYGRAHSTGDLVVFLPKEKVLAMADLWAEGTGEMLIDSGLDGRDGSVLDGPVTQRAVRALDFDIALPGHSGVMHGKAALDAAIANGERMVARIEESADRGDNVEETLQKMPPPPGASPFIATRWRRVVIRGFEEIELRRQSGMPLPGTPADACGATVAGSDRQC